MSKKECNAIGDVILKIVDDVSKDLKDPPAQPTIRASVLKDVASRMSRHGYRFKDSDGSMQALIEYLKGYCLWLIGLPGRGKSMFFKCINKVREEKRLDRIEILSLTIVNGWEWGKVWDWLESTRHSDVVLDDIGRENLTVSCFRNDIPLLETIIEYRIEMASGRTHVTSNIGLKDVSNRYGTRIADRFLMMFKQQELKCKRSMRVNSPYRKVMDGNGAL